MTDQMAMSLATVIASAARAQIRVAAMQSENVSRAVSGMAPSYTEEAIMAVIDEEGIGYNSVILEMRNGL